MKTAKQNLVSISAAIALPLLLSGSFSTIAAPQKYYVQQNLVSDQAGQASTTDPDLINGWGIAFGPFGPIWVADAGTGKSTIYNGTGTKQSIVVTIPLPPGSTDPNSSPTGIVFNGFAGTTGAVQFPVSRGTASGSSNFIFATEQGTIAGWSSTVDPANAIITVNNSVSGAIYKGLALGADGTRRLLYATDFRNGKVDVFDSNFQPITDLPSGAFTDPKLPTGYAPFGIHNIQGAIYVTYAKQDQNRVDDVPGARLGYVSIFDARGQFIKRLISKGRLNAPWGIALAPADFGQFGNRLLVGNFGDGKINVYDPATGAYVSTLRQAANAQIVVDGLWGISFGNGINSQGTNQLFFAAGPNGEAHGLFGYIQVKPTTPQ
ncbi:TIGR03118 family protein [Methylomagnum sp.]